MRVRPCLGTLPPPGGGLLSRGCQAILLQPFRNRCQGLLGPPRAKGKLAGMPRDALSLGGLSAHLCPQAPVLCLLT